MKSLRMTADPNRPVGDYCLISPARNEAQYIRRTLDSVLAQTVLPKRWIIIDDGSTDETPEILAEYAAKHDLIEVLAREDRGRRALGGGVVEVFDCGLELLIGGDCVRGAERARVPDSW